MTPSLDELLARYQPYQLDELTDLAVRAAIATSQRDDSTFSSLAERLMSLDENANQAVYESVLQTHLFVGFPKTIHALRLLRKLGCSAPEGLDSRRTPEHMLNDGAALCEQIYGDAYPKLRSMMASLHPDFDVWMVFTGYGRVLSRPGLTARQRELSVLPVLADQEAWPQLQSHTLGALRCGADEHDVWKALMLWAAKAPSPLANEAVRVATRALAQAL